MCIFYHDVLASSRVTRNASLALSLVHCRNFHCPFLVRTGLPRATGQSFVVPELSGVEAGDFVESSPSFVVFLFLFSPTLGSTGRLARFLSPSPLPIYHPEITSCPRMVYVTCIGLCTQ